MKNIKRYIRKIGLYISTTFTCVMLTAGRAFASGGALSSAADKAAQGIHAEAKSVLPSVIMIALIIIGIALIVGGQRGREMAKTNAFSILLGIALIIGAAAIASWSLGLF